MFPDNSHSWTLCAYARKRFLFHRRCFYVLCDYISFCRLHWILHFISKLIRKSLSPGTFIPWFRKSDTILSTSRHLKTKLLENNWFHQLIQNEYDGRRRRRMEWFFFLLNQHRSVYNTYYCSIFSLDLFLMQEINILFYITIANLNKLHTLFNLRLLP